MDNQGIRYLLLSALMDTEAYEAVRKLVNEYDEATANMRYNRAYVEYKLNGWTRKTEKYLKEAVQLNPHVPEYLLGKRIIPRESPAFLGIGDENEAIDYVQTYVELWHMERALVQKLEALVKGRS
ncbi:hypothetical protein [Salicibibacter kimchii]|uniref:Tetratricopeptide repeat protein n=1 Tax=Salicibibacter kimchii TaxID=2099786 RepID=A0A345BWA2_9BACI|nr:hypothetical protein [Salicibibacter kimchii]AXF55233.1 hypothetical protein DT065_03825 [Salicibibacter kimchii]